MFAGLQALLTIPVLSIHGWVHPSVCIILDVQVSVPVLCEDRAESLQGDFLEMLIGKEKVAFHQKGIFVEISLL